jgi:hypothetical protein
MNEPKKSGVNLIEIFTFIMVCSLTIAQSPLQKIASALTTKYQVKAQKEVCEQILQKREVYGNALVQIWTVGCVDTVKQRAIHDLHGDAKAIAKMEAIFADKDDPQFIKVLDFCANGAANWHLQADPDEVITSDLMSHFKCKELWKEEKNEKSE